ncbi:hypothetical protein B5F29_03450 [Lachnoclostridium sp. An196]|nr:hypothetical protein B5F29_03450 [Lachnoclostridium sp. An196]
MYMTCRDGWKIILTSWISASCRKISHGGLWQQCAHLAYCFAGFAASTPSAVFCSPQCKNKYNV